MRINPYTTTNTSVYGVNQNHKKTSISNEKTSTQDQTTANSAVEVEINDVAGNTSSPTSANKFEYQSIAGYKAALKISNKPTDEELKGRATYRDSLRGIEIQQPDRAINPDRLSDDQAKAAKYGPIQSKMLNGQMLTAEERAFLRENYPAAYSNAVKMESEVVNLRNQLSSTNTKEDAQRIYTEALMQNLSTDKDSFNPGMALALEKEYRKFG